jgi:dihydroneopterin aldolase
MGRRVPKIEIELAGVHQMVSLGVYDEERARKQQVRMDITIVLRELPREDDISATANYDDVAAAAREVATSKHFDLIERMAIEVAERLKTLKHVDSVRVRIRKIPSVLECDELYASVEM